MQTNRTIGLAGLGLMGRGIARCLLEHGFSVIALDPNTANREAVGSSELLTHARAVSDMAGCELVIESITEDLAAKEALYDELEACLDATTVIASNTSGFPITLLQAHRKHPGRFAGMHWMSPAYATRFMEIVRGEQTDERTMQRIASLADELGKEPAIVEKDVPGFIANRIAYAMYREAIHLVEQGAASIESVDLVCRNSLGVWLSLCGPFRWMDITGGPALYARVMATIVPTLNNSAEVPETMKQLQAQNKLGAQSAEGFYSYGADAAAEWEKRLHEHATKIWRSK